MSAFIKGRNIMAVVKKLSEDKINSANYGSMMGKREIGRAHV